MVSDFDSDKYESLRTMHAKCSLGEFLVHAYGPRPANWRLGQTLFNRLRNVRPDLSEQVRGTQLDPFHSDSRIPNFKIWLEENW